MLQGLEKYGVGKWREISEEFLPKWDDQSLRIKSARLLGSQSLARYVGWKGAQDVWDPAGGEREDAKSATCGDGFTISFSTEWPTGGTQWAPQGGALVAGAAAGLGGGKD